MIVRLQIVFENGGIYLDTDVELLKNLDFLLNYSAYFGFEEGKYIATGLGFGAVAGSPVLKDMMSDYHDVLFVLPDGSYDMRACPLRNTRALLERGLIPNDTKQVLDGNILILPTVYLCPVSYFDGRNRKTKDTISIHWFTTTWKTQQQRDARKVLNRKIRWGNRVHNILHLPHRILRALFGNKRYNSIKKRFKR